MFSEFLYVVVSYMVASQQEQTSSAVEMGMLEPMLALIALGSLGASVLLPRKLLTQAMGSEDPEAILGCHWRVPSHRAGPHRH